MVGAAHLEGDPSKFFFCWYNHVFVATEPYTNAIHSCATSISVSTDGAIIYRRTPELSRVQTHTRRVSIPCADSITVLNIIQKLNEDAFHFARRPAGLGSSQHNRRSLYDRTILHEDFHIHWAAVQPLQLTQRLQA